MKQEFSLQNNVFILVIIMFAASAIIVFTLLKFFVNYYEEEVIVDVDPGKNEVNTVLQNCAYYFDGCNNCFVDDGKIGGCTKKKCLPEKIQEPGCLKYINNSGNINVQDKKINNFNDCVKAGNPIMESYPRQCRVGDRTFTEEIHE